MVKEKTLQTIPAHELPNRQRAITELYAIASTLVQADYLDDLIEELKDDKSEATLLRLAIQCRRLRRFFQIDAANMMLQQQFKNYQKQTMEAEHE